MFKDYRDAYDQMHANPTIQETRKAITLYQERLTELEQPYRDRMAAAQEQITAAVLESKKTTTLFGVVAKYFKGRTSVSWKSVALHFKPPQQLIDKHTNVGKPSVTVSIDPN